jgi:hypothetical protein
VRFGNDRVGADSLGTDTPAMRLGERVVARWVEADWLELRTGLDIDVFMTNLSAQAPSLGEQPSIPSPGPPMAAITLSDQVAQIGVAPFVEQVFRPGPLELTLGFRAEYMHYGTRGHFMPDPRAVVRLEVAPRFWLKAGSGLFSQAPLPFQVLREAGNPALRPNRALQNSIGAEVNLPFHTELETSLFYNAMWQLTRGDGTLLQGPDGRVRPAFYADDARGRSYGWELLLRRRVTQGLFGWLSYTLSRSERYLPGGKAVVFNFDQTHVLNFAASYQTGAYRFGARMTLATGRPVTDLYDPSGQSAIFDADADDLTPSARNRTTRLPTYHQLDVRIDRDFAWGPLTGSVYLDIINVYNAQNSEAYQYEYDLSKRGKLPGLPFLPTLGIRGVLK